MHKSKCIKANEQQQQPKQQQQTPEQQLNNPQRPFAKKTIVDYSTGRSVTTGTGGSRI